MSKNNDYTTSNLFDYYYFSKHYKLITVYLSKQTGSENPDLRQQVNFLGKKIMGQQCFSSLKNQEKQLLISHKIMWISCKLKTQNNIDLMNYSSKE